MVMEVHPTNIISERPRSVRASLNYLAAREPRPVNYAYEPPAGVPRRSGVVAPQTVEISDGRQVLDGLSLDANGFVLVPHLTVVEDFYDSKEVQRVYYPEVDRLLKQVTGAERVLIFDHVVRNPVLAARGEKSAREPGRIVHNDYSLKSAPRRVRDHLPAEPTGSCKTGSLKSMSGALSGGHCKMRRWRFATRAVSLPVTRSRVTSSIPIGLAKR
jgi:hypothetical protein